jgi:CRISPR-associated protein Csb3
MNRPKPSFSVNVDVTNPGQFFACCGLLELAHRLWPGAEGWFEDGRFCVSPLGLSHCSLNDMIHALIICDAHTEKQKKDNGSGTELGEESESKINPVLLGPPIGIRLGWWLRDDGTPNLFKTWAANATSQQMFRKWREPLKEGMDQFNSHLEQVFDLSARVQGSYGFDSQLGWDALAVGFSLNEHAQYKKLPTHPAVELLGAVGLQRFFPDLDAEQQIVRYSTWHAALSPAVARLAAIGMLPTATKHRLRTRFVYRGSFKGLDVANIVQGDSYD